MAWFVLGARRSPAILLGQAQRFWLGQVGGARPLEREKGAWGESEVTACEVRLARSVHACPPARAKRQVVCAQLPRAECYVAVSKMTEDA